MQTRALSQVPQVDLYLAGFPCQPFNDMGKKEGFQDAKGRGEIFWYIRQYPRKELPKVSVLENVKGFVKINKCRDFNKIMKLLEQVTGLDGERTSVIKYKVMDNKEQSIPHSRPRWYCVGIRKDASEAESLNLQHPLSFW